MRAGVWDRGTRARLPAAVVREGRGCSLPARPPRPAAPHHPPHPLVAGFYLGGSSEAGSGARHLSSLPPRDLPAGTPEQPGSGDPITSLRHVAAFEDEAEAAVDRAARVALAAAEQKALRPLPPPPHLRLEFTPPGSGGPGDSEGKRQQASSGLVAAKRPLLAGRVAPDKENRQGLGADSGKRLKTGQPTATNPFSSFACTPGST